MKSKKKKKVISGNGKDESEESVSPFVSVEESEEKMNQNKKVINEISLLQNLIQKHVSQQK